jgi:hypothetical protein
VRQFLTWQFWLSLAALAALTIVLVVVTRSVDDDESALVATPVGDQSFAPRRRSSARSISSCSCSPHRPTLGSTS